MKQLDIIFNLRRDIDNIEERLVELRQMTQPKSQVISDMPRGGGERRNAIEEYLIKSEKLAKQLDYKRRKLEDHWEEACILFREAKVTVAQCEMLKERFYHAKPWKACLKRMSEVYPDSKWNEQKLFRMYRDVIYKINKVKKSNIVNIAN